MKCPNCVLGDLQFLVRGELRFQTDAQGRPCGTADIHTTDEKFSMRCDTCNAGFGISGWKDDGAGQVILIDLESALESGDIDDMSTESDAELEPKAPPPPRIE